jgi:hypothetical protein
MSLIANRHFGIARIQRLSPGERSGKLTWRVQTDCLQRVLLRRSTLSITRIRTRNEDTRAMQTTSHARRFICGATNQLVAEIQELPVSWTGGEHTNLVIARRKRRAELRLGLRKEFKTSDGAQTSPNARPTSCKPTGKPWSSPQGTTRAGRPARLTLTCTDETRAG